MRHIVPTVAAIAVSSFLANAYEGESAGQYWARERGQSVYGTLPKAIKVSRNNDLAIILAEARRQGVPDRLALKVCKVESGCRLNATGPRTKHGQHFGAYQIRPSSAARFGYRGGSLQGLAGLRYGMAHLADCYRRSGGSEPVAARCHVAGPGALTKRIAPWAERYAQSYQRQVANAWAGTLVAWR
jgi:soluble lytic murein transglycosylase-like protein